MEVVTHGVKGLVPGVTVFRPDGVSAWPGSEGIYKKDEIEKRRSRVKDIYRGFPT